jgi:hypothetical protein
VEPTLLPPDSAQTARRECVAADLLQALCSPLTHQLLRRRDGWSATDYEAWLTGILARTIIAERTEKMG